MPFNKPLGRCTSFIGAIALATLASTAPAETMIWQPTSQTETATVLRVQFIEETGASERVDQSGKLRMLSQRVVATGCYVRAGIDTTATLPALVSATNEFNAILNALEFGDPERGIIGAEERRRTVVGLGKLRERWLPVEEHAKLIAAGAGDGTNVAQMAELSAPLLEFAKVMVSEISAQYSDPTILLQADAMVIDIAGRQRMLSQRISKNACLLGTGLATENTVAELNGAIDMFETSLYALYHGMADAGVKAPPTEEIGTALAAVVERWNALKPVLASIGQSDSESLGIVYTQTTALTAEMNAIVGLYSEASKLGI